MPPGCGLAATVSARPRVLSAAERVLGHPGSRVAGGRLPSELQAPQGEGLAVPVCPSLSRAPAGCEAHGWGF